MAVPRCPGRARASALVSSIAAGALIGAGCGTGITEYWSVIELTPAALLLSGPASSSRNMARAVCTSSRRAGSFSSRPISTRVNGPLRCGGAGGSSTTACMVSIGSPRSKGGRPSTAV